jgi:hypothetical protein
VTDRGGGNLGIDALASLNENAYPFRREQQLVFNMAVPPDHVAMAKTPCPGSHLGNAAAILIE